ncbi:MAG TPA: hypothetical protein PK175_02215 [Syntrophales bacterium]|nr:hypothetical protein [Syntrophales bacterium]HQJ30031.1 hypothetical protein [Syntrophales bacterium]
MKKGVFLPAALIVLLIFTVSGLAASGKGCITCHTDGELLKSLYKPPVIDAGAGEG